MHYLQTQQPMKQLPTIAFKTKCKNRSFLWCIQFLSFHNSCTIHAAIPLYMVLCHSSEPVKSWKQSARKRCHVTRLSASHENRSPTAQLAQRPTEKPGAILTRVRVPGGARDLSPSHLSIQTLLRYSHSPRVQSHASTSVSTLKTPSTGSHIPLFGHHNTAHTDSNG